MSQMGQESSPFARTCFAPSYAEICLVGIECRSSISTEHPARTNERGSAAFASQRLQRPQLASEVREPIQPVIAGKFIALGTRHGELIAIFPNTENSMCI